MAYDVSADGSVVVGAIKNNNYRFRAFRWTEASGRMQELGTLGGDWSVARGVSADGSVVVGIADRPLNSGEHAFRWTLASGRMQDLGTLGGLWSWALGVSADGSVVVGVSKTGSYMQHAFRWTLASGQMQNLGTLGGESSSAYGASADGSIVVGWARIASGGIRAFRWTVSGGMEDLNTTYANLLSPGAYLEAAYAISPDGRFIVGNGYNSQTNRYEAFLLDTQPGCAAHDGDVDNNGCVDDADLLAVLFAFGNTGSNLGRVDVNCDGVVDDADLLIVLFNFGSGC
jgi:probable HAF family extracellular repeat protein